MVASRAGQISAIRQTFKHRLPDFFFAALKTFLGLRAAGKRKSVDEKILTKRHSKQSRVQVVA